MPVLRRAPHGHAIDLNRRNPHAHRHALAFLAAYADAFVQAQVVPHHADVFQGLGSVPDQRGVAHGTGELTIFDEVTLGRREDEVSAGDVHLAAAEIHAVEALRYRPDDIPDRKSTRLNSSHLV